MKYIAFLRAINVGGHAIIKILRMCRCIFILGM
jgi:uncharacterized protein (DUF1697 family)